MVANELKRWFKIYVAAVYLLGAGLAVLSLSSVDHDSFTLQWVFLTLASVIVGTVNLRLPTRISAIVSMGDVFVILILVKSALVPPS